MSSSAGWLLVKESYSPERASWETHMNQSCGQSMTGERMQCSPANGDRHDNAYVASTFKSRMQHFHGPALFLISITPSSSYIVVENVA